MKNFFKGSLYLFVFALAGIIFQISCSNSENDHVAALPPQTNKLIFSKQNGGQIEIWTCGYDGSAMTQIPIALPANTIINSNNSQATPRLSPDGQTVFFVGLNTATSLYSIYTCDITGNNLQQITTPTTTANLIIGNAI